MGTMASIARSLRPVAMRLAPRATPMTARTAFRTFSTTRMTALRKYTKDHEWIDLSADQKTGVVGISEYAAEQLGDVVYVELPEESGSWIEQGDGIGAVESVKSASDINAPVRLKIVSVNKLLEDDSHGGGWVAKVEVDEAGAQQVEALMDAEAYKTFASGDE